MIENKSYICQTKQQQKSNIMKTFIIELGKRESTKKLIGKLLDAGYFVFEMQNEFLKIEVNEDCVKCLCEIVEEENLKIHDLF